MDFIERLKKLRTQENLSQKELAKVTGLSLSSITKWEAGIIGPSVDAIIILAMYFDVSTDYLLGVKDE